MKKIARILPVVAIVLSSLALTSAAPQKDEVMTKEDGMYVVNSTTLGKNVTGYVNNTPVKIYIKKDKIVKIEALKNEETPKYMARVKKGLLGKWDGLKVKEAQQLKVDGVTGATLTSNGVAAMVKDGLTAYKEFLGGAKCAFDKECEHSCEAECPNKSNCPHMDECQGECPNKAECQCPEKPCEKTDVEQ